jgi:hypothetical protein
MAGSHHQRNALHLLDSKQRAFHIGEILSITRYEGKTRSGLKSVSFGYRRFVPSSINTAGKGSIWTLERR